MERSLNLDVPGSIAAFEAALHYFELKTKMYQRLFRSRGLEFEQFRQYSSEDDSDSIDWKASLRAQEILVRQYREEKDLQVVIAIDVSDSMIFGSGAKLKCEYAAEVALALAHLILASHDKVGFVLFSDKIVQSMLPQGGMRQFYFFNDVLSKPQIYGGPSLIVPAIEFVTRYFSERVSAVFLISDFLRTSPRFDTNLRLLSSKFETIPIMIKDIRDRTLPDSSMEIILQDPHSGEQLLVNPQIARRDYEIHAYEQEQKVITAFKQSGLDYLSFLTSDAFALPLARFLKERIIKR